MDDFFKLTTTYSIPEIISPSIFRAYDIRGIVGEGIDEDVFYTLGLAIGSRANDLNRRRIIVGRDARTSSKDLCRALCFGLMETGRDVIDIGEVPTPLMYYATHYLAANSGVIVTASHNPAEYNGMKIVLDGKSLSEDDIQQLYYRILAQDFITAKGTSKEEDIVSAYLARVLQDVTLAKPLKIVVDSGNSIAGKIAPHLYRALECEVIELFCEVDGSFPNHHPDPSVAENLHDLINAVKEHDADIGLAFDGDGDRLGIVSNTGEIVCADRQLMLMARDILERNVGAKILYDVKCSRHLREVIEANGGVPLMWKTGHSYIKNRMRDTGALLAGEMSGHIFYNDRWYGFDDAIYAGARLLEIIANQEQSVQEIFTGFPNSVSTPEIKMSIADTAKYNFMEDFIEFSDFCDATISTLDGIRVDFDDGWGLMRASNTSPYIVFRFEADNEKALNRIQNLFREQLVEFVEDLILPF